ncbi:hypothetical protein CR513_53242, partial [Mucuna pruriens]
MSKSILKEKGLPNIFWFILLFTYSTYVKLKHSKIRLLLTNGVGKKDTSYLYVPNETNTCYKTRLYEISSWDLTFNKNVRFSQQQIASPESTSRRIRSFLGMYETCNLVILELESFEATTKQETKLNSNGSIQKHKLDVKPTFLNELLQEEIYYIKIYQYFMDQEFMKSKSKPALYIKT